MMSALDDWLSNFGLGDEPYEPIWIGDAGARELRGLLRELAELRARNEGEGPGLEVLLSMVPGAAELTAAAPLVREGWEARWELYTEDDDDERGDVQIGSACNTSLPAAIRAATLELLGLDPATAGPQLLGSPARVVRAAMAWADVVADRASTGNGAWTWTAAEAGLLMAVEELRQGAGEPRRTCSTCEHWQREGEPATSEGARLCRLRPDVAARTAASSCDRWERLPEQIGAGVTRAGNVVRAEPEGDR